eukprot:TRINITY_DN6979_c0_g2_i1.p1 TRINITY_DN6979_c0_g2~~TRINITY_DN6979_c0_g2_i1.p1  ORF type:complete len:541 (-),score=50.90 TRINITY_DN6979_c0_g2_i1:232-1854(-)
MAGFRLWLLPLHRQTPRPLRINEMQHASSHDERIFFLREVCREASTHPVDVAKLAEVIVHPDDLVVRGEQVGMPMRLPLRLSQIGEYDVFGSLEGRSDGVLGFVAYGHPMIAYTASWRQGDADATVQADVWVFAVTDDTPFVTRSKESNNSVFRESVTALTGRGAIAGDTRRFEMAVGRTAKGGFGTVLFLRSKHDDHGRVYAGKLVDAAKPMSACAECDYLLEVGSHPNIVSFIGAFCFWNSQKQRQWMIMTEAHLGGDVEVRVRRRGAFSDREALEISRGVLQGICHLHRHLVMHRDVKPANVVLASDGRAVLIDMGLSVHESESTKRKKRCGTPGFMAPEIILGHGCQYKSDVFGCGALLYFLASGIAPFVGSTKKATTSLNAKAHVPFDDARFLMIAVHTIEMMRNMLQQKPSRRPKARSMCSAITLAIELTSATALPHDPSQTLEHDISSPGQVTDQECSSARQSMSSRLYDAVSRLASMEILGSFSVTSNASNSGRSVSEGERCEPNAKAQAKSFFKKVGQLLGRVRQVQRQTS